MELTELAPWIALAAGVVSTIASGVFAWRAWRVYTSVEQTRQAAVALVDVHRDRLEDAIVRAGDHAGALADGGEDLAEAIAGLRGDVDHLRWLLTRIPEERARLKRELLDLVLPTDA